MDRVDSRKRSQMMSSVRSRDTAPEIQVRRVLHGAGYRFRINLRGIPGKPDIVFPGKKKIIFIHGCFWHHHRRCKKSALPKTNEAFWRKKIMANVARDKRTISALNDLGWNVMVVWECECASPLLMTHLSAFLGRQKGYEGDPVRT